MRQRTNDVGIRRRKRSGTIAIAVLALSISGCVATSPSPPPPPPPPPTPIPVPSVISLGSFPDLETARAAVVAAALPPNSFVVATVAGNEVRMTASGDPIEFDPNSGAALRPPKPPPQQQR